MGRHLVTATPPRDPDRQPDGPEPPPPGRAWGEPGPPGSWGDPPGPRSQPAAPPGSLGDPAGAPGWGTPGYAVPSFLPKAGSARTGPLPLHPMTFADILDGAFKLLKANFKTIVQIAAIFVIPLQFVSAFLQRDAFGGRSLLDAVTNPDRFDATAQLGYSNAQLIGTVIAALVGLLVAPFVGAAITRVVAASYLGEELPLAAALRTAGRRFAALLGAFVCVHLLELVGLLLCGVGVLVPMTFFLATTPALVIEGIGPIRAMGRSAALRRPRFWPTMGIAVVSGLMAAVLGSILSSPFTLAGELLVGLKWGWPLVAVGGSLPALVTTPFIAIVATLVYFDGRIRQEGFDLQVVAASLAGSGAPA